MSAARGDLSRLAKGGVLSVGGGVVGAVATMALTVVLTHGLGATASGSLFRAIALFNIAVAVVTLGSDAALVRFVAAARHRSERVTLGRVALVALGPVAVLSVALAAGAAVFADPPLAILATALPFGAIALAVLGATRGFGTMLPTVAAERLGRPILQLLLVGVAVATTSSADAAAWAWAAAAVIGAAVAVAWLAHLSGRQPAAPVPGHDALEASAFWRFALPRALAAVARSLVLWLDVVLVGVMISSRAAAIYTVATRLVQAGIVVIDGLGQAVEPMFASVLAAGDAEPARPLYRTATAWMMLATWPLYWVLTVLPEPLLSLFGDGFRSAAAVTAILALSALVGSGSGPIDVLLVMAGRSGRSLGITLLALGIDVVLNLVLIPWIGIEGAAIAWATSRVVTNVLPMIQVRAQLAIHPFSSQWWAAAAVPTVVFGGGAAMARALLGPRPAALLAVLGAGGALYVAALWRLRDRFELDALVRIGRGRA